MTALERGILLLCCCLGQSEVKPLSGAEFMRLERALSERTGGDEPVTFQSLVRDGIDPDLADRICDLLNREELLDRYLEKAKQLDIGVVTRLSPAYPHVLLAKLREHAPLVLFYRGDAALLQSRCVGLVGSRKLTPLGEAFARRVGALCAVEGRTLVSGGAAGADRTAQQACTALEGKVVVFTADRLMDHPAQEKVLYCSEEGYDLAFSSPRAHSRNRLIHALGERTFVAQCTHGSGGTWTGTVENLKKEYSPVICHQDGSSAMQALQELGAQLLDYEDMTSVIFPEQAKTLTME